eukprot:scaffold3016_cov54-Cylindrotheca_fusiformis.AAC.2
MFEGQTTDNRIRRVMRQPFRHGTARTTRTLTVDGIVGCEKNNVLMRGAIFHEKPVMSLLKSNGITKAAAGKQSFWKYGVIRSKLTLVDSDPARTMDISTHLMEKYTPNGDFDN